MIDIKNRSVAFKNPRATYRDAVKRAGAPRAWAEQFRTRASEVTGWTRTHNLYMAAYWQSIADNQSGTYQRPHDSYRIIVTGSRSYTDVAAVRDALIKVLGKFGCRPDQIVLVEGEADGLDSIARDVATELGMRVEKHPADWDNCAPTCNPGHRKQRRDGSTYCPSAGHRRNTVMVAAGAVGCIAWPLGASPGTRGCMALCEAAGIPVWNRGDRIAANRAEVS